MEDGGKACPSGSAATGSRRNYSSYRIHSKDVRRASPGKEKRREAKPFRSAFAPSEALTRGLGLFAVLPRFAPPRWEGPGRCGGFVSCPFFSSNYSKPLSSLV